MLCGRGIKGVGPKTASALLDTLGEGLVTALDQGDEAALQRAPGVGRATAKRIAGSWRALRERGQAAAELEALGLAPAIAQRVEETLGAGALAAVMEDPYALLHRTRGLTWRGVDVVGRRLGVEPWDPRRVRGAFVHVLRAAAQTGGHCCLAEQDLLRCVCREGVRGDRQHCPCPRLFPLTAPPPPPSQRGGARRGQRGGGGGGGRGRGGGGPMPGCDAARARQPGSGRHPARLGWRGRGRYPHLVPARGGGGGGGCSGSPRGAGGEGQPPPARSRLPRPRGGASHPQRAATRRGGRPGAAADGGADPRGVDGGGQPRVRAHRRAGSGQDHHGAAHHGDVARARCVPSRGDWRHTHAPSLPPCGQAWAKSRSLLPPRGQPRPWATPWAGRRTAPRCTACLASRPAAGQLPAAAGAVLAAGAGPARLRTGRTTRCPTTRWWWTRCRWWTCLSHEPCCAPCLCTASYGAWRSEEWGIGGKRGTS